MARLLFFQSSSRLPLLEAVAAAVSIRFRSTFLCFLRRNFCVSFIFTLFCKTFKAYSQIHFTRLLSAAWTNAARCRLSAWQSAFKSTIFFFEKCLPRRQRRRRRPAIARLPCFFISDVSCTGVNLTCKILYLRTVARILEKHQVI